MATSARRSDPRSRQAIEAGSRGNVNKPPVESGLLPETVATSKLSSLLSSLVEPLAAAPRMPQQSGPRTVGEERAALPLPVTTHNYAIPPHIMGRNVENPVDDIVAHGRRLQKPRLGVRVPYRNLTSQIVTQDELARELLERSLKKRPVHDTPEGGDLFFTMKLTQRLANRLSPGTGAAGMQAETNTNKSCQFQQPDAGCLLPPDYALVPESTGIPDTSALLAILEGEVEPDWTPESKPLTEPGNSVNHNFYGMGGSKLDPLIEKELALKQLMEFQTNTRKKKAERAQAKAEKSTRKPRVRVKKDVAGGGTVRAIGKQTKSVDSENNNNSSLIIGTVTGASLSPVQKKSSLKRKCTENNFEAVANKSRLLGKRKPVTTQPTVGLQYVGEVKGTVTVSGVQKTEPKSTKKLKISKGLDRQKTITTSVNYKVPLVNVENEDIKSMPSSSTKNSVSLPITTNSKPKKLNALGGSGSKTNIVMPSRRRNIPVDATASESCTVSNVKQEIQNIDVTEVPSIQTLQRIISSTINLPVLSRNTNIVGDVKNQPQKLVSPLRTYSPRKRLPIVDISASSSATPKLSGNNTSSHKIKSGSLDTTLEEKKKRQSRMREIDRLLMDEGAINLLYEAEHGDSKRRSGSAENDNVLSSQRRLTKPTLKSVRRKKKDLLLKTRLVKNAVLRLSNATATSMGSVAPRSRRRGDLPMLRPALARTRTLHQQRKLSLDSVRSPPALTPVDSPSPSQTFMYPPRLHLPAEASRIIRRHSSSSNFSSRSTSPSNVRIAPDARQAADNAENTPQNRYESVVIPGSSSAMLPTNIKPGLETRKKGVPIFVRKLETAQTYKGKKKTDKAPSTSTTNNESIIMFNKQENSFPGQKSKDVKSVYKVQTQTTQKASSDTKKRVIVPNFSRKITPTDKVKLKAQMSKNFQKSFQKPKTSKLKKPSIENGFSKARRSGGEDEMPELTSCLAAAASAFAAEAAESPGTSRSSKSPPPARPPLLKKEPRIAAPLSPNASTYSNLIKTLESESQKQRKKDGEESIKQRSSVRQNAGTFHYKEISLRRYDNLVQIILTPASTKMKNALNYQVLRELRDALVQLRRDDSCRAVLLTSTGSSFCQGVDFSALLHANIERRKSAAQELALALKEFLKCLALFNKPIVAGVHGAAVGLGVTMLPFFDMVFASDKATFYTPYAKLGQVPEGAAILTLPHMFGNAVTSELLFGCRKLTASEALHFGLVTRILWPDRFQEELIPIIRTMASQSAQSMEATKALLRHNLRTKLDAALESETHLLVQHWNSSECQNSFRRFLDDEDVGLQRQRVDP